MQRPLQLRPMATPDAARTPTDDDLVAQLRAALPGNLVGVYRFEIDGSATTLVATVREPGEVEVANARAVADVLLATTSLLRNWPRVDPDRLETWHLARAHAERLFGPPIASLIVPIPEQQYLAHVRAREGALED